MGTAALSTGVTRRALVLVLNLASLAACGTTSSSSFGSVPDGAAPPDPPPNTGPPVSLAEAPPPISGGTLLVTRDGALAVAADPDRDRVWLVDLRARTLAAEIALRPGDEPGRVVEDLAGRAHIALRRGGAVVTVDLATRAIAHRRAVCSTPRGLDVDPSGDTLYVACASGELVTLPASGGAVTRVVRVGDDLRDVIAEQDRVLVSRFRAGELLVLDRDSALVSRVALPEQPSSRVVGVGPDTSPFVAGAARRMVRVPGGGVAVIHQRSRRDGTRDETGIALDSSSAYYSPALECGGALVRSALSYFPADLSAPTIAPSINGAVLAVDVAVSRDGQTFALVAPGTGRLAPAIGIAGPLGVFPRDSLANSRCVLLESPFRQPAGEVIAVAFDPQGAVVVQSREPAQLQVLARVGLLATIALPAASRHDTGHMLFHADPGGGLACASCHLEGGEDGITWDFGMLGVRRTTALHGGLSGTEPFQWNGAMPDFERLAAAVFIDRMGGGPITPGQSRTILRWLDRLPLPPAPPPEDTAAVARGRALFEDATVGCASCHAGPHRTNNASVSVGTGEVLQVPSLRGLRYRAPYMHNGCAATLRDVFGERGGGDRHGRTSHLTPAQLDDLASYLQTL